jgi:signal transduction histidine kinase/CheY-like chemotaxis protein
LRELENTTQIVELLDRIATTGADAADERALAAEATDLVLDVLGLAYGCVAVGGRAERIEILVNRGVPVDYLRFLREQYMNLPGAKIIATGEPQVVPDIHADPAYAPFLETYEKVGVRAMVVFPLRQVMHRPHVVAPDAQVSLDFFGILGAYHPEPQAPDPLRIALARTVAAQLQSLLAGLHVQRDRDFYKREAALERSNEALATLTAGVAHDFNNVLGSVLAMATMLPGLESRRQNEVLRHVRQQAEQASNLTRSLIGMSRVERGARGESCCELVAMVQQAIAMTRTAADPRVSVAVEQAPERCYAAISSSAASRILLNLLLNAVQAFDRGRAGDVRVRIAEHEETCVIEVDDDGAGVAHEMREQIFEPFVSLGKGGGVGVGLSAARGLAERAGGSLALKHRSGPGACFVVTLPRAPAEEPVDETPAPRAFADVGNVLLAEDEPIQRMMFADGLRRAGYGVTECADGAAAMVALEREGYVAAVLDQRMPGVTGLEILSRLRASGSELPIVMVSGFGVDPRATARPEYARTRVVSKPLTGDAVVEHLRELLQPAQYS